MATPKTKIFVGHLPDGCRSEDLQPLFEKYGVVKECDVINKYGFVHMNTPEEADAAIKNLNNYNLKGTVISVEPSKSKLRPNPGASPGGARRGFPGGRRGGMPPRNGYGPIRRGPYDMDMSNGFRRYHGPSYDGPMGGNPYYDRPFGFGRDRMRPYYAPYERRSPNMPPPRDEYAHRPMPSEPPSANSDYTRPFPMAGREDMYERQPMAGREDLYERRPITERTDNPYSQRSPLFPECGPQRSYWYEDTPPNDFSSYAPSPQGATRRRAFYEM